MLVQELSPEEEERRAEFVRAAKFNELDAWKKFDVFKPRRDCNVSKQVGQTRLVLTWKMVEGQESVEARLAAKGHEDPDVQGGVMDAFGRISLRPPHLQVISLCAIEKRELLILDIRDAFLQASAFLGMAV